MLFHNLFFIEENKSYFDILSKNYYTDVDLSFCRLQ